MAIYHLSAQIIGRSAGRSVMAAAAYRSGGRLREERTDQTHDYTKRTEIESEIHTPSGAPEWMKDRERLWNAVDAAEKRKDAQLAREFNMALPKELGAERQRELVRSFVTEEFTKRGMVADVAIHRNDPGNPHAHVLVTMREVTPEGFGAKNREWNRPEQLGRWREQWAEHTNRELERSGRQERIDHRSLREQGVEREPGRHLGPAAAAMERKHQHPDRGRVVREVREYNRNLVDFQKAKSELDREKGILERHQARMGRGTWDEKGSLAVAEVERVRGGPVEAGDLYRAARESAGRAEALAKERQGVQRRLDQIVDGIHRARGYQAEIEPLRKQAQREHTLWRAVTDRVGDWLDRKAMEKAVLADDMDRIRRSMDARYQARNQAAAHRERLQRLPGMITNALEGKSEGALRQEWEAGREKLEGLAQQEREAKDTRELYGRAAEGQYRHREASLERDPEIQARHQARLESGVWRPGESREIARLEADKGGPVTREWLQEQAGRESGPGNTYSHSMRHMDHAEELGRYQENLATGTAPHDRALDGELKDIGREAMKELHPEAITRELARERTREDLFWGRGR